MADPGIVKVLHGADYDVSTLKRDFAFSFASLFDTMIAARLLGRPELGLAAVARAELGVTLSKDNQKDDWSRRPLTPQQEAYAAADVAHLVALQQRLTSHLESLGRLAWLREECDAVAALGPAARRRDPDAYLSIKGAKRLAPRALAALRELHRLARAPRAGDRPAALQDPRQRGPAAPRRAAERRRRTGEQPAAQAQVSGARARRGARAGPRARRGAAAGRAALRPPDPARSGAAPDRAAQGVADRESGRAEAGRRRWCCPSD